MLLGRGMIWCVLRKESSGGATFSIEVCSRSDVSIVRTIYNEPYCSYPFSSAAQMEGRCFMRFLTGSKIRGAIVLRVLSISRISRKENQRQPSHFSGSSSCRIAVRTYSNKCVAIFAKNLTILFSQCEQRTFGSGLLPSGAAFAIALMKIVT